MATYQELKGAQTNSDLQERVEVACWKWAADALQETPNADTPKKITLARRIFQNPIPVMNNVMPAVLAINSDAAIGVITGATDAQVQTNVNVVLDEFAKDLKAAGTE